MFSVRCVVIPVAYTHLPFDLLNRTQKKPGFCILHPQRKVYVPLFQYLRCRLEPRVRIQILVESLSCEKKFLLKQLVNYKQHISKESMKERCIYFFVKIA